MVRISRSISPHAAKADTRGRSSLVPARRVHGPRCSRVKGAAARRREERDSVRRSAARCAIIVMGSREDGRAGKLPCLQASPRARRAAHRSGLSMPDALTGRLGASGLRPQIQDASHSPALEPEERERSCARAREASTLRAPGRTSYSTRDQQLGGRANRFASHALPQCRVCYLCMGLAVPASRPAPATPDAGTPHPK